MNGREFLKTAVNCEPPAIENLRRLASILVDFAEHVEGLERRIERLELIDRRRLVNRDRDRDRAE